MCHQPPYDITQEEVSHTSYVFVNRRQLYIPATMQYCVCPPGVMYIHVCIEDLHRMVVTKLWCVRKMEIYVGIVRGLCGVVRECVGTVCMALLGTFSGCTVLENVHVQLYLQIRYSRCILFTH